LANLDGVDIQDRMKKMTKAKPTRWAQTAKLFSSAVSDYGNKNDLADLMCVSPSFVDSILRGIKPLPSWHAKTISDATKFGFDEFVQAHLEDVENIYLSEK